MKIIKEIFSSKVRLQLVEKSDAEQIHLLRTDPRVAKYIVRDLSLSVKDIEDFIEDRLQDTDSILFYKIEIMPTLELAGTIVLKNFDLENGCAELGYELFPHFQGQGIMTHSTKLIMDMAFEELGLKELDAITNRDNLQSRRFLERLGFNETVKKDSKFPNNVIYNLNYKPAMH
jgi:ribosomal-protein-alanine N-acetyltransferase